MRYDCPVCGYDQLREPPADWSICPCCRTEFGYSDAGYGTLEQAYDDLRTNWVEGGMKWKSKRLPPPLGWLASEQLWQAGLVMNAQEGRASVPELDLYKGNTVIWAGSVLDRTETSTAPRETTQWPGEFIDASVSFTVSSLSELEMKGRLSQQGDISTPLRMAA